VINFPVQTRGAGYTNESALSLDKDLDWSTEALLGHQHDSLQTEGPDPIRLCKLLEKHMHKEDYYNGFKMVYPVETKVSSVNFYHMLKVNSEGMFDKPKNPMDYVKTKSKVNAALLWGFK
jgi:hypothetical protein